MDPWIRSYALPTKHHVAYFPLIQRDPRVAGFGHQAGAWPDPSIGSEAPRNPRRWPATDPQELPCVIRCPLPARNGRSTSELCRAAKRRRLERIARAPPPAPETFPSRLFRRRPGCTHRRPARQRAPELLPNSVVLQPYPRTPAHMSRSTSTLR